MKMLLEREEVGPISQIMRAEHRSLMQPRQDFKER